VLTLNNKNQRSSCSITLSVWMALFLREALFRVARSRTAWAWLLIEPIIHVVAMVFVFTVIHVRVVGGIDFTIWLIVGLVFFFMFKRTAMQTKNALDANKGIFVYRQVLPVDTLLVRACLEAFLTLLVAIILSVGMALLGINMNPDDPLAVFAALLGLWIIGLGFGLISSVLITLIADVDKFINIAMTPLYMFSGVIFPLAVIPPPFHGWLMLNPLAHGIEAARLGMSSYYHAAPELSLGYLYQCALASLFVGLALHKHFATRLVMK
jgi:capsular polysaccharide transport system permease protein